MTTLLSLLKERRHRFLFHINVTKTPPPPVFMSGHELDISSSFTLLGLSVSSDLSWKTHIYPISKHASQKLGFLSRARDYFFPSQLLTISKSQIRPSLGYCSHVWGIALRSSLHLLDNVQPLSHHQLVADLSIFYIYFHGHCHLHIKNIVPDAPRQFQPTRSSTQSHPVHFILLNPRTLSYKSSFIPGSCQLCNTFTSTSIRPITYLASYLTLTYLISSPYLQTFLSPFVRSLL